MKIDSIKHKGAVIVVNDEDKVVYFNYEFSKVFFEPKIGDSIKIAFSENIDTRFYSLLHNARINDVLIFLPIINQWKRVAKARINWPNEGICHILVINDEVLSVSEEIIRGQSAYQEIYTLSMREGIARAIKTDDDMNLIPREYVPVDDFVDAITNSYIFKEDQEAFRAFLDEKSLKTRLVNSQLNNVIYGIFKGYNYAKEICSYEFFIVSSVENHDVFFCYGRLVDEANFNDEIMKTQITSYNDFYHASHRILAETDEKYLLIAGDMNHSTLLSRWYGRKAANRFLLKVLTTIRKYSEERNGIACYFGSDDFVMLVQDKNVGPRSLISAVDQDLWAYPELIGFLPKFGVYEIDDKSEPVQNMYEKALSALRGSSNGSSSRFRKYSESSALIYEADTKKVEEIEKGLVKGEITFYLQPKFSLENMKIVGAEALVRWNSPTKGIIMPDQFIPVLEKTSFIGRVDYYIWETVIIWLKNRLTNKLPIVPVSINVSIADIYTMNVSKMIHHLLEKYDVEPKYLEVEITESAYAENFKLIQTVIRDLHEIGITVLMDDFGTGYSSLASLKSLDFDIIKLDAKFLRESDDKSRADSIIESVINMSRLLGLSVIVEGIETEEQREFLTQNGCFFGQGYLFSKPLPIYIFEEMISDSNNIDSDGVLPFSISHIDIFDKLDQGERQIYESLLGAVVSISVHGESINILKGSDCFFKMFRNSKFISISNFDITEAMNSQDKILLHQFLIQCANKERTTSTHDFVIYLEKGESIYVEISAFYVGEKNKKKEFVCRFKDVSERHKKA